MELLRKDDDDYTVRGSVVASRNGQMHAWCMLWYACSRLSSLASRLQEEDIAHMKQVGFYGSLSGSLSTQKAARTGML